MVIDLANRGATCRIGGYPQVTFYNAKSVAVDHHDIYEKSMAFTEPRSVTVTLAHGAAASIGVTWSDNVVNNQPYNTTCPTTVTVLVNLRKGVGHLWGLLEVVSARPCGGSVSVTPIESGAWPRSDS
jgi:hypothetical protein